METTGTISSFSTTPKNSINIGSDGYTVETAGKSYSLTEPDSQTLRFEVQPGDQAWFDGGSGVDRSEIQDHQMIATGTPVTLSYQFMVEPGATNTASWLVAGEMHNDDPALGSSVHTSPPFAIQLAGDKLQVVARYCPTGEDPSNAAGNVKMLTLWTDPNPIVRGQYNDIKIQSNVSNTSAGYLEVWVNGNQVVNYHGPLGYGAPTYWEEGLYRSTTNQDIAADYRNLAITTGTTSGSTTGTSTGSTASGGSSSSGGTTGTGTGTSSGGGNVTNPTGGSGSSASGGSSSTGTTTGTGTGTGTSSGSGSVTDPTGGTTGTGTSSGGGSVTDPTGGTTGSGSSASGGGSSTGGTTGTGTGTSSGGGSVTDPTGGTTGSGSSASGGSSSTGGTTGTGTGTPSGGGSVTDPTGGTTGSGSSASGGSSSTGGTAGTGTGTSSGSGSVTDPTGGNGSGSSTSSGGHHHHWGHWGNGTTGTGTGTSSGGSSVTDPTGGTGSTASGGTTGTGTGTTVGTGASGGATAPQAPAVTIANPSLSVTPGQGVDLGVSVTLPNATDNVSVNVQGLPGYETITDKLDNKTFSGSNVTLTAAEVNSGLTLNSSYKGNGHPTSTLTVTATDQTNNSSSAAQSIAVTDPVSTSATGTSGSGSTGSGSTASSGSSSHGGCGNQSGGGHHSNVSQWFDSHPGFAKTAKTLSDAFSSKSGASSAAGSSTNQAASAGDKAFALFNQMMAGDFGNTSHFTQGGSSSAQAQQQTSNQLTRPLH